MSLTTYRRQMEVSTLDAEPIELVRMLYRGALEELGAARESLKQGDIAARGRQAGKAAAIVTELATSLDHNAGGDISRSLGRLYDYILGLILQGSVEQKDAPFAEAQSLMRTLLEAWNGCRTESDVSDAELVLA